MNRQSGNPRVNTGIALLAAVGVAAVGAQSPYRQWQDRGQTGKSVGGIILSLRNRARMAGGAFDFIVANNSISSLRFLNTLD